MTTLYSCGYFFNSKIIGANFITSGLVPNTNNIFFLFIVVVYYKKYNFAIKPKYIHSDNLIITKSKIKYSNKEVIMLELFILETCPYCKKVMKFLEEKQIKYNKNDTANEDNVLKLLTIGGKDQVPFLYNSKTNEKIYDSDEIINYLGKYVQD
jgi:glutaredoxin